QRFARRQQAQLGKNALGVFVAALGEEHLLGFLVDPVVAFGFGFVRLGLGRHALQERRHGVHAHVQFGVVFGLARDDQRRTGFVDQRSEERRVGKELKSRGSWSA